MSIPVLTPLDSPIFDEDVIAVMEEHFDDHLPCKDCERTATWRRSMRCCDDAAVACTPHEVTWRLNITGVLLLVHRVTCAACGHEYAPGTTFEDLVREVPL